MNTEHRYLVVTVLFLPTKGGSAVWFDEVYRRLGRKKTHIVTADVPGSAEHDANHPNTIHRVVLRRHWWLRPESLIMYTKLLLKCVTLVCRQRFDAVHAGRVLPEGLVAWMVARIARRRILVYAHGEELTTWTQPWKFRIMKWTYRHADRIVANSEYTRDRLLELGVTEEQIRVVYPGVDLDRFRRGLQTRDLRALIDLRPEQKLIVSVGRLSRRKGFDQVIRSLPKLGERGIDAKYVVVGVGQDESYLLSLALEMGVHDRVHLLGHVSMDDLPRWYNVADIFAMPNRDIDGDTEGFGMVFVEAAACGKPVVAGESGGTGSAVVDGVTGLRVDGTSTDAVADALVRLCQDAELANELGQNGEKRANELFSWRRVAEEIVELCGRTGS